MEAALLVPITLFAAIAYSIKAVVDARVRKQLVASNGAPDLVRSILAGDESNRRLASLRWVIWQMRWLLPTPSWSLIAWSQ